MQGLTNATLWRVLPGGTGSRRGPSALSPTSGDLDAQWIAVRKQPEWPAALCHFILRSQQLCMKLSQSNQTFQPPPPVLKNYLWPEWQEEQKCLI